MMRVTRLGETMAEELDYAGSGVDIDLEGDAVGALVGALSRSVRKAGTPVLPLIYRVDLAALLNLVTTTWL